jgi:hypothetical protein
MTVATTPQSRTFRAKVDLAAKRGKINGDTIDAWMRSYEANPSAAEASIESLPTPSGPKAAGPQTEVDAAEMVNLGLALRAGPQSPVS